MAKYTDELVAELARIYVERRGTGELNADILADLVAVAKEEFDTEVNEKSIRSKLMNATAGAVYIKDTEEEKAILEVRKGKVKKAPRVTKAEMALEITKALEVDADLADDLAKAKVATLKALLAAVK